MQIQGVNVDIPQLSAQFAQSAAGNPESGQRAYREAPVKPIPLGILVFDEVLNTPGL